jgi:hypothetical protein
MTMRKVLTAVLFALFLAPPALAAGRELAPRPLIPKRDFIGNIAVASAGGRFLTAWVMRDGGADAIYGAISDANGQRLSPAAFLVAETDGYSQVSIDAVGTEDSFALFWTDGTQAARMTDVDLDGNVLRTRALALPSAERVIAAWDGERFLAAVFRRSQYTNRSLAAFVARDGTILRDDLLLERNAAPQHIAVHGDGFLVFSTGRDFFAHVVGNDGAVTQRIAGDPAFDVVSAPIGDGRLLVAYAMGDGQLRAAVWKDGAKLTETTVTVERFHSLAGILPGDGRHLLAFIAEETLHTVELDDTATRTAEPLPAGTEFRYARGAANDRVLFVPHSYQSVPVQPPGVVSVAIRRDRAATAKEVQSVRPAPQSHVLVGAGGGSMIAAWNEQTLEGESRVRTAHIDRNFETAGVRELAPGALAIRSLAWNGTEYLAVYATPSSELVAMRVAYDGDPIGEPVLLGEAYTTRAAVTWAGDRWAVAWASSEGYPFIHYRTVSRSGVAAPLQELHVNDNVVLDVALAFDGSRVHLAWVEAPEAYFERPPGYAVFTTRLRRNGRAADTAPLTIPTESPRELAMATNGDQVVLLIDAMNRTSLHVIDADTRQLVSTRTLHEGYGSASDVKWDGDEFVAAVRYLDGGRAYAEVRHLGDDGTADEDPCIIETLARGELQVSVASSPAYDAVLGLQESDAASGPRAVIHPEREMFRLP